VAAHSEDIVIVLHRFDRAPESERHTDRRLNDI